MDNPATWLLLGLNMVGTIVGVTWKLSRMEASLREMMSRTEVSLREAMVAERKEIDANLERESRHFGETAAAIRTKVHELELHVRDHYVRSDGFHKVRDELSSDIKQLGQQLYTRLERMEAKIDNGR